MKESEIRAAEETRKRGRGNPNMKLGVSSVNPSGKPKAVDQEELESLRERVAELEQRERDREAAAAEVDGEGGQVTAPRMRKVLGQDPVLDVGPTEQRLREWLVKDVSKFEQRAREMEAEENAIAELKAETGRLRAENTEWKSREAERGASKVETRDEGSERALAMLHTILGVSNGGIA